MSRIGRQPIEVPSGVTVEVSAGGSVTVTGPLGTLRQRVPQRMAIAQAYVASTPKKLRLFERSDWRREYGVSDA